MSDKRFTWDLQYIYEHITMSEKSGFLTPTDREFLRGEKEYHGEHAKQNRYQRRQGIAERTRAAFEDFALLFDTLDEHERNRIFDPPVEETTELMDAVVGSVAFLYYALEGDSGSNTVDWERSFRYPFSQVLEAGVRRGEIARQEADSKHQFVGDPEVTFDVDVTRERTADRDRVVDALARNAGRELTEGELRQTIIHAADETTSSDGFDVMIDGEPVDNVAGLHGLAEQVEQRAEELKESDDVDST